MVYAVLMTMLDGVDYLQEDAFDCVCVPSERARPVDRATGVWAIAVVEDEATKLFDFDNGMQGDDVAVC